MIRLELVQNANDQATMTAKSICGEDVRYHATTWFRSTQYDLKLQNVGLSVGHDATVTRGEQAVRSFAVIYPKFGKVIAIDCVDAVEDYAQGRKLVEAGVVIAPEDRADTAKPLKELLAAG